MSLVARVAARFAMEFPTEHALDSYLEEHPAADLSNHSVKPTESEPPASGTHETKKDSEPPPSGVQSIKGVAEHLQISDADIDAAVKEYGSDFAQIEPAMKKALERFKASPKHTKLKETVSHLPEAEQMLLVAGHEIGAYFEDMVVKNHNLHKRLTNQWRKNPDNEICLELSGLLHSMGVKGGTRASDKKNHFDLNGPAMTPGQRLKKIREKGARSKVLHDYVKELVLFQRAFFKHAGIKELSVYRGVKRQVDKLKKDDEVTLNCREASSFTLDPGVAKAFGRVIAYKVPVESVLMSPITSPHFGSSLGKEFVDGRDSYIGESELVLMGGSAMKGKIYE